MNKVKMSDEALALVASRFKVLGEPMRLRLLHELQGGERTVTELMKASGASQANVSKHLAVLMQAGMVNRRKDGVRVFYFVQDPMIFDLCDLVCGGLQRELARRSSHFA